MKIKPADSDDALFNLLKDDNQEALELLFKRFYVMNQEQFWNFRKLNAVEKNIETEEFQKTWKKIEEQLFKFEWILTKNMMKRSQWLDKTIWAFYDIIYSFFPLYGGIR